MPHDAMQEASAVELMSRNWRYHKSLRMWLTKDPLSEPIQHSAQAEQGVYIFFDPNSWEKIKVRSVAQMMVMMMMSILTFTCFSGNTIYITLP